MDKWERLLAALQLHAYKPWLSVVSYEYWRMKCESDSIVHTSGKRGSIQPARAILTHCIETSALWPLSSSCHQSLPAKLFFAARWLVCYVMHMSVPSCHSACSIVERHYYWQAFDNVWPCGGSGCDTHNLWDLAHKCRAIRWSMAPVLRHFKLLSSEHPLSCAIGLL